MTESPTVHLCRVPDAQPETWPGAVERLLDAARPLGFVKPRDRVAIKVHVGEPGKAMPLPPEVSAVVAARLRALEAHPFFTDTAVLYTGPRSHGVAHTEVAVRRGFTLERAGAVFIPADGLAGNQEVQVEVPGRHSRRVGIAAAIADAQGAVIVSHATGHLATGFGATLKNLGMGCAARKGKLAQHSDTKPFVTRESCTGCGECVESCPSGALAADAEGKAVLDDATCIGCGECLAQCAYDAIGFRWDGSPTVLQEKMVEHALGAARALKGRYTCLLGIVNLTKHCDCWGAGSERVAKDVGFALSSDPVALDQAALDLVASAAGRPLDRLAWPKLDGSVQLEHAERLGLGRRSYRLLEVG